jgi:hypothetical protein
VHPRRQRPPTFHEQVGRRVLGIFGIERADLGASDEEGTGSALLGNAPKVTFEEMKEVARRGSTPMKWPWRIISRVNIDAGDGVLLPSVTELDALHLKNWLAETSSAERQPTPSSQDEWLCLASGRIGGRSRLHGRDRATICGHGTLQAVQGKQRKGTTLGELSAI